MVGVVRIDPHHVVVHVLVALSDAMECLPRVVGHHVEHVHGVHAIHVVRIGEDLAVVQAHGVEAAHPLPIHAAVTRAEESALRIRRLDDGVNDVRIHRRDREADAPHVFRGW